jgi:hypothetical protein
MNYWLDKHGKSDKIDDSAYFRNNLFSALNFPDLDRERVTSFRNGSFIGGEIRSLQQLLGYRRIVANKETLIYLGVSCEWYSSIGVHKVGTFNNLEVYCDDLYPSREVLAFGGLTQGERLFMDDGRKTPTFL